MKWTTHRPIVVGASIGLLLQLAGLWWALGPGQAEVSLVVGTLLWALGTPCTIFAIERYATSVGRSARWALLGLAGPLGLLGAASLRPRSTARERDAPGEDRTVPSPAGRSRADRIVGGALAALLVAAMGWAALRWLPPTPNEPPHDRASQRQNEQRAYERLLAIAAAQQRYIERDWDGDGRKTFAEFAVHLWRSVDGKGEPVPVELISRELGFAMVAEFALDGYVFHSLHWLSPGATGEPGRAARTSSGPLEPIDHERAWAVLAHPAEPYQSGVLSLLADETGAVWAAEGGENLKGRPTDPAAAGWVQLRSAAELTARQQSVRYRSASQAPE